MIYIAARRSLISVLLCILPLIVVFSVPAQSRERFAPSIDLYSWEMDDSHVHKLNGQWAFVWQELIDPDSLSTERVTSHAAVIEMPAYWNGLEIPGVGPIPGVGYATMWVDLLLPPWAWGPQAPRLSLLVEGVSTAHRAWVDGVEVATSGRVAASRSEAVPQVTRSSGSFRAEAPVVRVTLHMSNFDTRKGGAWNGIRIGTAGQVAALQKTGMIADSFLAAAILTLGLYHFGLYFALRRERESLYFGIFCLLIALRTIVTETYLITDILPVLPWWITIKAEYLTFYAAVPVFIAYMYAMFPGSFSRFTMRWTAVLGTIGVALVIVLPSRLFSQTLTVYQIGTVVAGVSILVILASAVRKQLPHARPLALGFVVMFASSINDILYANQIIHTRFIFSWGLFVFVFSQALMIIRRYAHLFFTAEQQRDDLQRSNHLLETELSERSRLESDLREFSRHLEESRTGLIVGLARLAESRDTDTGVHLERITSFTRILAMELRKRPEMADTLSFELIDEMVQSAALHDIGKVGIPDAILQKPGRLTPEEFNIMKTHTTIGGDAIMTVESRIELNTFLRIAREIAYSHHEKWDGSGYPEGLRAEAIPLAARIVACADVYDALTSVRPYKGAMSHQEAAAIIREGSGSHFDPVIVEAFQATEMEFDLVRKELHLEDGDVEDLAVVT